MAKLGVDRFVIERVLGHTDRSVTAIYDRYARLPECRKALDLWARHLRRVIGRSGK
jgi:integrase